jgi:UDP-N-acetylglucosamine--N-acetylmuramyl-(pentapeptide) pyrophosphoryl-undecaprenol N-acetylglucosamine transferase
LISAGGTGGGVYPALAVLEALNVQRQTSDVLWIGGEGGMEATLVERAGVPFRAIPAAGVHGVNLRQLPGNLGQLARGVYAARRILHEFKPDVMLFTGGYAGVPVVLAGWKIPSLLYVPDIEPGLALKALARFAKCIALTASDSRQYFSPRAHTVVTGYPTRAGLTKWTRSDARKHLGISDDLPMILVFGGSKGARSINTAVLESLPTLLELAQIVHISGELDWPDVQASSVNLPKTQSARYHAFPYLHEEMGAALAAADLAITRAGASTLGELPLFGLPAILVPYPHAWRYQKVNASYLADRGAAVVIEDAQLTEKLIPTVNDLLVNPSKLESMRMAMRRLSHPQAAAEIGRQLLALAIERS